MLIDKPSLRSLIPCESGIFCPVGGGHILAESTLPPDSYQIGAKIQAVTMLEIFELEHNTQKVGFFLYSAFKVVNKGGVLLTYLESKKGKAGQSLVVLRHPLLVVYDIPGCGSMAVSTKVNDRISSILNEQ
jgi:hypothetical protein